MKRIALCLVGFVLSGCTGPTEACDDTLTPGLLLTVRDSATGAPLGVGTAVILERDGVRRIVLRQESDGHTPEQASVFTLLAGLHGTYTVRVEHEGYQPWQREEIRVEMDRCGDARTTVELVARLQRGS